MRVASVFRYEFPFEYWGFVRQETDGALVYDKLSDHRGLMAPGAGGGIYLYSGNQMVIGSQVRNLRDRSGAVVSKVGDTEYPLYVHSAEPQLDPFSSVIAWRHTLRREPPRDMEAFIKDIVDRASGN